MTDENILMTNDLDHPSVCAVEITSTARGTLSVEVVDEVLAAIEDFPPKLKIGGISPNVALKRTMVKVASGDSERDVKTTGRRASAVYTVLRTNLEHIDRENSDGLGCSDAEVSARISWGEEKDSYTIKISPLDHPAASYIRKLQDETCGEYSSTYDLKVWLNTRLLPFLGAIKAPDAQGKYLLSKKGNEDSLALLREVQEAFKGIPSYQGKLRIYLKGVVKGDADAIDIIADAIADERERVCGKLLKELDAVNHGDKKIGKRRLASMVEEAHNLRGTLKSMADSFGMAHEDSHSEIKEVERYLGACELALG